MKPSVTFYFLIFMVFLLTLGSLLGLGFIQYHRILNSQLHSKTQNSFLLEVTPGMTLEKIFNELEKNNVIERRFWVTLVARIEKLGSQIKVGEYEIHSQTRIRDFFSLIKSGKTLSKTLTIPEGYNLFEISHIFEKENLMKHSDFMSYVRNPDVIKSLLKEDSLTSLEGYLFPESYQITKYTQGPELIERMVKTFLNRYQNFKNLEVDLGWSRHRVITLASIIEKETGASWERPLISKVFHNRLKKGMKLQTDPTVLYAKALESGIFEIRISRQDLTRPHSYNTYYKEDLPPGPIANPGAEAIQAVFYPDPESQHLYFVSRNDGTHIFSETYEEHNKAVTKHQKDPKAREGRSWRDLKKNSKKEQESERKK
jgi:UPF0755 protein